MRRNCERILEGLKSNQQCWLLCPCSASIKSEESERNELSIRNDQLSVTSDRQANNFQMIAPAEKNYILCHVRKIDQKYKSSKFNGAKKTAIYDLEDEVGMSNKRKRKKSSRREQVNALSKAIGSTNTNTNTTTTEIDYDEETSSFPKKFYSGREESVSMRAGFPMFMPDTGTRISFESENSISSNAFPAMGGYVSGMMTTMPQLASRPRKGSIRDSYSSAQLAKTAKANAEVKAIRSELEDKVKVSATVLSVKPSKVDNIIATGMKKVANDGGCDYMQLFNMISKCNNL